MRRAFISTNTYLAIKKRCGPAAAIPSYASPNAPITGAYPKNNPGIKELTGDPDDEGKFRTPSLRNVALTAPYMHDGSIPTLGAVIREHYAIAGHAAKSGKGPSPMRSSLIAGFEVSPQEVNDLVAFLNSLTDESFVNNPKHSDPWITLGKPH